MRALGKSVDSVVSQLSSCARNVSVGVIVDSLDVQTSFAPMRIVTYCAPCETAVCT